MAVTPSRVRRFSSAIGDDAVRFGDGRAPVLGTRVGDVEQIPPGGRVGDGERVPVGAIAPLPADQQLVR